MPPTTPRSGSATAKCVEREQPPMPVHTNHALHPSVAPAPTVIPPPQLSYPPQSSYPRPLCHSCAPFRHSCAGRNHATPNLPSNPPRHTHPSSHPPTPTPSPIHPSPPTRGEVRWGVGSHEPTHQAHPAPIPTPPLRRTRPNRHTPAPSVTPAPSSVILAQAGTTRPPTYPQIHPTHASLLTPPNTHPFPNSSLPPYQGGGEVGGGQPQANAPSAPSPNPYATPPSHPPPPSSLHLLRRTRPLRHSCAPLTRHSCAGRNGRKERKP